MPLCCRSFLTWSHKCIIYNAKSSSVNINAVLFLFCNSAVMWLEYLKCITFHIAWIGPGHWTHVKQSQWMMWLSGLLHDLYQVTWLISQKHQIGDNLVEQWIHIFFNFLSIERTHCICLVYSSADILCYDSVCTVIKPLYIYILICFSFDVKKPSDFFHTTQCDDIVFWS